MKSDKIFIDIGSHFGSYTLLLAPKCKHVYAFEAQQMTYYQLCGGIALNRCKNVTAFNYGLTCPEERDLNLPLYITTLDGGGSTFNKSIIKQNILTENLVQMKCLDDFNLNNICLIKIDVEGYELNVIKGAIETIKRSCLPPILFEAWAEDWYIDTKKNLFIIWNHLVIKYFQSMDIHICF